MTIGPALRGASSSGGPMVASSATDGSRAKSPPTVTTSLSARRDLPRAGGALRVPERTSRGSVASSAAPAKVCRHRPHKMPRHAWPRNVERQKPTEPTSLLGRSPRNKTQNERLIIGLALARSTEHLTLSRRCGELLTHSPQHLGVWRSQNRRVVWRARRDSNPRPADPKSEARGGRVAPPFRAQPSHPNGPD